MTHPIDWLPDPAPQPWGDEELVVIEPIRDLGSPVIWDTGVGVLLVLKGRDRTAQGNALGGDPPPRSLALKGRNGRCPALSGRKTRGPSGDPGRCPGLSCPAPSGPQET